MEKLLPLLCWAFVPIVAASALAQTGDGYVSIYGDSLGKVACTSVPPFTSATLFVIAKTAGEAADAIAGAEFRIEVSDPAGWLMSYAAPGTANIIIFWRSAPSLAAQSGRHAARDLRRFGPPGAIAARRADGGRPARLHLGRVDCGWASSSFRALLCSSAGGGSSAAS
jgi:hypothetical protein